MKRASGSFGARHGAAWSSDYATYRSRREGQTAQHRAASIAETITPPSREAMQRAIQSETCPFCGSGPWKNLGMHTNRTHGISAAELREMSGLRRVCSEELSEGSRERLTRRPDFEETTKRATEASAANGAWRIALAASVAPRLEEQARRRVDVAKRIAEGDTYQAVAEDFGVSVATVMRDARDLGVRRPQEVKAEERRALRTANIEAIRSGTEAAQRAQLDARLHRFDELGGDYAACDQLAAEVGVTSKAMRAYLRENGVKIPDGRSVSDKRGGPRPHMRGKPNRDARVLSDAQMHEINDRYMSGDISQKALAALYGVSQGTVHRIVTGKFVKESA